MKGGVGEETGLIGVYSEYPHYTEEQRRPSMGIRRAPFKKVNSGQPPGRRKLLVDRRKLSADYAMYAGMFGIIVMIIQNELFYPETNTEYYMYSVALKTLILVSTMILLGLIVIYHFLDVQLFVMDTCAGDWRIAMTWQRIVQIVVELGFCALHPVPSVYYIRWTTNPGVIGGYQETRRVPSDLVLSLCMFLRLYLVCRVMLLHSKLFTGASIRSIAALNRVKFNTTFVLKTLMSVCPGTVLLVFLGSFWIIASWSLKQCEKFHNTEHANLPDCFWLIAITFFTVGFGDIVPETYCGRGIALSAALMGAGCTALLVAVISKKLELSNAEMHVHNMMKDTELKKNVKNAAANVLRQTWLIYKYTHLVEPVNKGLVRSHRRKFMYAIYTFKELKREQRKMMDDANNPTDMAKMESRVYEIVTDISTRYNRQEKRLMEMEDKISSIEETFMLLPEMLSRIGKQCKMEGEPEDTSQVW